jgi:hypothetical protein
MPCAPTVWFNYLKNAVIKNPLLNLDLTGIFYTFKIFLLYSNYKKIYLNYLNISTYLIFLKIYL